MQIIWLTIKSNINNYKDYIIKLYQIIINLKSIMNTFNKIIDIFYISIIGQS